MNGGPAAGKQIVPGEPQGAKDIESILESAAPEIMQRISKKNRAEFARLLAIRQTTVTYTHSGPLPSPDDFKRYDAVVPGAADRIIKMAESQQTHRMTVEMHAVVEQLKQSGRGQMFALLIALVMIAASTWMVVTGHDVAGGCLGGTTLVALVTVFVTGRAGQAEDLAQKQGTPEKPKN